ncbi:MAG: M14 family zinc carboxypeptidase, partial [Candidatus Thermoplasmatota archaeon]|nr:M14 family zinc carboxypeptidase [Candidatus Thermoplasmatota archaeon]
MTAMLLPLLLSLIAPVSLVAPVGAQDAEPGYAPEDIWSDEYAFQIFPWGPHGNFEQLQFREYHDYFSMKERMQTLAAYYPDFLQYHEGLLGGVNARGDEMTAEDYEGWFYKHSSPWMKITGNVQGGDYNDFNDDDGNYADRPDVMLVGNHHAREWMSYEVPMFFLETIAYYYGKAGIDNDGDGQVDEDPWNGIDDDGDCSLLNATNQDSNGDGTPCGPGDLGVDEDFSEQFITDMVNTREIYLIPMLNTDGNRYDREEYCGETAWENCYRSGWRKNLRDNTVTGVTPIPDVDEEVDEGCDGVDLNRNYQFEWGA